MKKENVEKPKRPENVGTVPLCKTRAWKALGTTAGLTPDDMRGAPVEELVLSSMFSREEDELYERRSRLD